jgi:hypothetical protein
MLPILPSFSHLVPALLLALLLRRIPARQANVRYLTACGALLATVFAVCMTWSLLEQPPPLKVVMVMQGIAPSQLGGVDVKVGYDRCPALQIQPDDQRKLIVLDLRSQSYPKRPLIVRFTTPDGKPLNPAPTG